MEAFFQNYGHKTNKVMMEKTEHHVQNKNREKNHYKTINE